MSPARLERLLDCLGRLDPRNAVSVANDGLDPSEDPFTVGELREFLAQRLGHTKLTTASRETVEEWSDALADCACWFRGFRAASEDDSLMPPAFRTLTEINIAMKQHLEAVSAADNTRRTKGVTHE